MKENRKMRIEEGERKTWEGECWKKSVLGERRGGGGDLAKVKE